MVFLTTKHGLAAVLRTDHADFKTLHAYFPDRLVPVCAALLDAAAGAGGIRPDFELCIGAENDPRYNARRLIELFMAG